MRTGRARITKEGSLFVLHKLLVRSRQPNAEGVLCSPRVRLLKEEPHSQRTAEEAVGLGIENGSRTATAMEIDEEKSANETALSVDPRKPELDS